MMKKSLQEKYESLESENRERVKELTAIYRVTDILKQNRALESALKAIAQILPSAWQFPDDTVCRISYRDITVVSLGYVSTTWRLSNEIVTDNNNRGIIEVCYLSEKPKADVGPFLYQEVRLLNVIAGMITGYINSNIGKIDSVQREDEMFYMPKGKKPATPKKRN